MSLNKCRTDAVNNNLSAFVADIVGLVSVTCSLTYEGRSINKLQNGIILLIFKI